MTSTEALSVAKSAHGQPSGARVAVVFRDYLGMGSETFIYAQAGAMRRFVPHLVGSRIGGQLPLGCDRVRTINGGGRLGLIREAAFKFGRISPSLDLYLAQVRPSLVHAHFGPDGAVIAPFAYRHRIPLVVTFHGFDATVRPEHYRAGSRTVRIYGRRKRWLQATGTLFLAVSEFIRQRLIEQGYPPERVVRHYIGIDVSAFAADRGRAREPIVLFVGRLTEKKGCAYLLEAMTAVQQRRPDIRLVVIGEGPLRQRIEARAAELRVNAAFLGAQPPHVVRDWMARATVFSVPSVTAISGDAEGFGIVFAESAALGTPVASFASGGIPEAVKHGVTGLLAPERDVAGLAHNILALVDDPDLRARMGAAGIERVNRLFDIRRQTATLEDLYDGIAPAAR